MRETGLGDRPYGALVAAPEVVAGVGRLRKWEQIPPAPELGGQVAWNHMAYLTSGVDKVPFADLFISGQFTGQAYGRA